jgi:hypothetical protein
MATTPTGRSAERSGAVTPATDQATRTRSVTLRAVAPSWTLEERREIRELRSLEARAAADAAEQAACRLQRAQRRRVIRELGELAELAQRLHAALLLQARLRRQHAAAADERERCETLARVLRVQCWVRARFAVAGASPAVLTTCTPPCAAPALHLSLARAAVPLWRHYPARHFKLKSTTSRPRDAVLARHLHPARAAARSHTFKLRSRAARHPPIAKLFPLSICTSLHAACRRLRENRALHEEMHQFAALRLRSICARIHRLPLARIGWA